MSQNPFLEGFMRLVTQPVKPSVFVAYHHDNDQWYADQFSTLFDDTHDVVTDRSLDDPMDSSNTEYIYQQIRDKFISGTSCTIVLCGIETFKRKYVDWEIKATLDKGHGLLGIVLPTHRLGPDGKYAVPDRLYDNIESGYAHFIKWTDSPQMMASAIDIARELAKNTRFQKNLRPMMGKNC